MVSQMVISEESQNPSNAKASDQNADAKADTARDWLQNHPQIKTIITQWVDVCGVVRSRMTSSQRFLQLVASGQGFNQGPLDCLMTSTASLHPDLFAYFCVDRGYIVPDASTLLPLPEDSSGINNTAIAVGEGSLFGMDPRANLRRLVAEAQTQHNLNFLVGFEIEICFFKAESSENSDPFALAGPGVSGLNLLAATHRSTVWPILNEAVTTLADAGILVEQVIKEYGASQWELSLPPFPPTQAVDVYIYTLEVVKTIAQRHGIVATCYPTPYAGDGSSASSQKSGQHIHLSAKLGDSDGRGEDSAWNPDELMAGLLSHTPALMAIGLSQVDSYERVGIAKLATGGLLGWGDHHRDMPIRRIHRNHWEIRFHDATSNPYAMVAGMIAAALDRKPLTIGNAKKFTPFLSKDELAELGQTQTLPASLGAALDAFETDKTWAETALGAEYVKWFLTLKRAEMEAVSKLEVNARRKLMIQHF